MTADHAALPDTLVEACADALLPEMYGSQKPTAEEVDAAMSDVRAVLRAALATGQVVLVGDEYEWRVHWTGPAIGQRYRFFPTESLAREWANGQGELQRRRITPEAPWEPVDP